MGLVLSAEFISGIFGFILSFLVEKVPGVREWWAATEWKEVAVAVSGLVLVGVLVGLYFAGAPVAGIQEPFIWNGLIQCFMVWGSFVVMSQSAYLLQKDNLERRVVENSTATFRIVESDG